METPVVVNLTLRKNQVGAGCSRMSRRDITSFPARCSECNLRRACLPGGMEEREIDCFNRLVHTRHRVERDESLYRAGDTFKSLYVVRSGFFKTYAIFEDGREQVTGFQMVGEIIGMDGIETDTHQLYSVALEDSEVCVISFASFEEVASHILTLQHQFHKMMSRELTHARGMMMLLGGMRAEERIAAFLLNLSHRLVIRGYAATEFNLRMTREEIGSYLGVKLETVSRTLSKFQQQGLISVQQKYLKIHDIEGLNRVANSAALPGGVEAVA
jgi:CRP/FNR family transcriptional regulator